MNSLAHSRRSPPGTRPAHDARSRAAALPLAGLFPPKPRRNRENKVTVTTERATVNMLRKWTVRGTTATHTRGLRFVLSLGHVGSSICEESLESSPISANAPSDSASRRRRAVGGAAQRADQHAGRRDRRDHAPRPAAAAGARRAVA
eukprot:4990444-Prymnesium_polylepis.1